MQFLDFAKIHVRSGSGGNGAVSFRREKYIEFGGPDGGNGGHGGNVILKTVPSLNTLIDFKFRRHFHAQNGKHGMGRQRHGAKGKNIIIEVPQGTEVLDESQSVILFDLIEPDHEVILLRGGNGGFGNYHFKSSTNQAPKIANKGQTGVELTVFLRLKILADVGLVGLPNSGKSTFLSKVTKAKPKIGSYPFTTLYPQLGTIQQKGFEIIIADIPGIIEGSSEGKGLGNRFLGHIERCSSLLHLIDASSPDPVADYNLINSELVNQGTGLENKSRIVALSKADLLDSEKLDKISFELKTHCRYPIIQFSSQEEIGLHTCVEYLLSTVQDCKEKTLQNSNERKKSWTP